MNKTLRSLYLQFRRLTSGGWVGHHAEQCLNSAHALLRFRELESLGLVRLSLEAERENYFDVYGTPDTPEECDKINRLIESTGCWYLGSEWRPSVNDDWEVVDGIGMLVGYRDPEDPFENSYVPGLMHAAVSAFEEYRDTVRMEREENRAYRRQQDTESHAMACRGIVTVS